MADADFLVDRDLDMVDVIAIPDRLEHAVGKAQHQDVLHRLLAEVMIDPVNLVLVDDLEQFVVQRAWRKRGRCRTAFRSPAAAMRAILPSACRCGRVPARSARTRWAASPDKTAGCRRFERLASSFSSLLAHRIERGRLLRIGLDAGDAFQQTLRDRFVHRAGGELAQALQQAVAQFLARHALAGDADHAEFVGQEIGRGKIIERGNHQPVRQIAGDAEDDEGAGIGLSLLCGFFCHDGRPLA